MENILADFWIPEHPDLLIGIETRDDAGVFKLNEQQALIQTVDFFTPMVDDPFIFGQIAATNAMNDIYAMGGKPLLVMNLVCYPECGDMKILQEILGGGLAKIKEAGALLVGGHTVDDIEPKYGLSVSGLVHPEKVVYNSGACKGDLLVLTKPLGNGIISTAVKAEMVSEKAYNEAVKWMVMLNREACGVMQAVGVSAATDVTGFGLIGHLYEMVKASNVNAELYAEKIEFMEGVTEYANMGLIPGGAYVNRDYLQSKIDYDKDIDPALIDLLSSPETAGGLLIAVSENRVAQLAAEMAKTKSRCSVIGRITDSEDVGIMIKRQCADK